METYIHECPPDSPSHGGAIARMPSRHKRGTALKAWGPRFQEKEAEMPPIWLVFLAGTLALGFNLGVMVMALFAGRDPN